MIRDLSRELVVALARFVRYRTRRMFQSKKRPAMPEGVEAATTATAQSINALGDTAGLDPAYERPILWPFHRTDIPSQEVLLDPLYQMWRTIPGGHKWTHYFGVYRSIFESRRSDPLRVLEIGVLGGASLKLWRKYFENVASVIVGIDISTDCAEFDAPSEGIHVRIGSQTDPVFLKQVVREFGPFDLIIDDGSHFSSHIITSFNLLYGDALKDDGIYFAEDLHANYWHPWRDSRKSFLDVCKELLDHMHAHYRNAAPVAFLIDKPSHQSSAAVEVPLIATMVREIRFFDSMVAVYKTRREHVPYYLYAE